MVTGDDKGGGGGGNIDYLFGGGNGTSCTLGNKSVH